MHKVINDKSALDKFYRKLFFYKSFILKKTKFTVETNYEEVKSIIKALNIKKRKPRITYIYDEACKQIDNHYKNKNICGFKIICAMSSKNSKTEQLMAAVECACIKVLKDVQLKT